VRSRLSQKDQLIASARCTEIVRSDAL